MLRFHLPTWSLFQTCQWGEFSCVLSKLRPRAWACAFQSRERVESRGRGDAFLVMRKNWGFGIAWLHWASHNAMNVLKVSTDAAFLAADSLKYSAFDRNRSPASCCMTSLTTLSTSLLAMIGSRSLCLNSAPTFATSTRNLEAFIVQTHATQSPLFLRCS